MLFAGTVEPRIATPGRDATVISFHPIRSSKLWSAYAADPDGPGRSPWSVAVNRRIGSPP